MKQLSINEPFEFTYTIANVELERELAILTKITTYPVDTSPAEGFPTMTEVHIQVPNVLAAARLIDLFRNAETHIAAIQKDWDMGFLTAEQYDDQLSQYMVKK